MKISQLAQNEATRLAAEAQQKGISILGTATAKEMHPDSVHFIGLCQLISELRKEIVELKLEVYALHQSK